MVSDSDAITRRNRAIERLGLLERSNDPHLTGLTRILAYITGAPGAAVHILDDAYQRPIAVHGAPMERHPREDTLCRLVVDGERRIVCADASEDARFGYSTFVQGPEPLRFYAGVPLRLSDGAVIGTLCAFDTRRHELSDRQVALMEDLADQVVAQIELTQVAVDLGHMASHDPLTGAVNRLVLGDRLAQAFARRRRHGGETFVALLDVDRFKSINDELGHDCGDQVLVEIARRLTGVMRHEDTVSRIGGDEFVVLAELVPSVAIEEDLARRLEDAVADPIELAGEPRCVEVSVGCVLAQPGEDMRSLLCRADEAMYRRKLRSGAAPAR